MSNYCNDSFFEIIWPPITQPGFYVQVAILSASFICSMLGVILDVVFICRKKTNFLVRLFVYLMVVTTIELVSVWPNTYGRILIQCDESLPMPRTFVLFNVGVIFYCLWVQAVIACSISVMLMKKLYNYTCGSTSTYASCWRNQINSHPKCMEAIIVTVLFGLPVVPTIITATIGPIILSSIIYIIVLIVVSIIPVFLSLLGDVVLLIWFCWLRRRRVARIRTRTVLKEITLFFLLLFAIPLTWVFLSHNMVVSTILSVFIAILPYLLLLYMCLSFRSSTRQVRITPGENRHLHINTTGPGLQTAPPSTRVSLPSDTADHAPNFLSPSGEESSEVTPLLNNN